MTGHVEGCVERYLELAKKDRSSLKKVATPCIDDHQLLPEDFEKRGELADSAARIVLKALYVARMKLRSFFSQAGPTAVRPITIIWGVCVCSLKLNGVCKF